jgi:hypothetical protein
MTVVAKLAGFAAVLVVAFGVAAVAGGAIGPDREGAAKARAEAGEHGEMAGHGGAAETGGQGGAGAAGGHGGEAAPVRGLAVADGGLRLALATTSLARDSAATLRFAINDAHGPVHDFDLTHTKRMHLIVVRRDGQGFQHLHPTLGADGTWSAPVTLPDAGAYRVFADFMRGGEARTLAADLTVNGDATYSPLPAANTVAQTDGYTVKLAARGSALDFAISRGGKPVQTEPYLGAGGHLVALREGDLAFLHVHPTGEHAVAFEAALDTSTRYRLYLQFKHAGQVHTAEFTR